jgi:hypothetical protein
MSRVNYAAALDTLAASMAQLDDPGGAIAIYERAGQQIANVDAGAYPEIRADILEGLATNQLKLGRRAEALRTLGRLDALNRSLPPDHERRRRADALRARTESADGVSAGGASPGRTPHPLLREPVAVSSRVPAAATHAPCAIRA